MCSLVSATELIGGAGVPLTLLTSIASTSAKIFLDLSHLSVMTAICAGIIFAQKPVSTPAVQPAAEQANARRQMEDSIERQKQAIRRQTGAASSDTFFTVGWVGAPMIAPSAGADCDPLSDTESEPMIKAAATAQKLNPALIRAVIRQESGFRSCAVSPKGAMGLMQLMPDTAAEFHLADPFNAVDNVGAGAQYLKQLMERYKGDLKLALAAYNAGPGRVDGEQPTVPDIPETQDYVNKILAALAGASSEAQAKAK